MKMRPVKQEMAQVSCITDNYDVFTLLVFWNKVLIRIGRVQKSPHDPSKNFHDAALDLKTLRDHFDDEREMLIEEGFYLCQECNIEGMAD